MPATNNREPSHEALERIFHEPNRLAIMSAVCAAEKGLSFTELKEACRLTDGNLNRHLKALEEAGAVRIEKTFVQSKPRTTVRISRKGLDQFSDYLAALEGVLEKARKAVPAEKKKPVLLPGQPVPVRNRSSPMKKAGMDIAWHRTLLCRVLCDMAVRSELRRKEARTRARTTLSKTPGVL